MTIAFLCWFSESWCLYTSAAELEGRVEKSPGAARVSRPKDAMLDGQVDRLRLLDGVGSGAGDFLLPGGSRKTGSDTLKGTSQKFDFEPLEKEMTMVRNSKSGNCGFLQAVHAITN